MNIVIWLHILRPVNAEIHGKFKGSLIFSLNLPLQNWQFNLFLIYLTFSLFFHFKVTVLRTILGLDVTSSRNHHAVNYHEPAIAHPLFPVWRGGRGWTRKLMRWELSFLAAWRKEKWDLVSHSQTYSLLHIITYSHSLRQKDCLTKM